MRLKLIFSLFILLMQSSIYGQLRFVGSLYNNSGTLKADTLFRMEKEQLKKWSKVEFRICSTILDSLRYPQIYLENGISGEMIISFTLDHLGNFGDISIEKNLKGVSEDTARNLFFHYIVNGLCQSSGKFMDEGFCSATKRIETYYIPISFIISNDSACSTIRNDHLEFSVKPIPEDIIQPIFCHYPMSTDGGYTNHIIVENKRFHRIQRKMNRRKHSKIDN